MKHAQQIHAAKDLVGDSYASFWSRRSKMVRLSSTSVIVAVLASTTAASPAHAQLLPPAPSSLVSVCTGISLPRSTVTDIVDDVVLGIYAPLESNINSTLGVIRLAPLGLLGLPTDLSVDVSSLLTDAASGAPITLQALATDGTLVGPSSQCDSAADSYTLDTPAGLAIGGNRITGLGANGQEALAGEIDSIALGNRAATAASATGSIAIGRDSSVGANAIGAVALGSGASASAANSVALGQNSIADRAGTVSVGAAGAERAITNVANGTQLTDAVNMSQLNAVAAAIPANAVQYDDSTHTLVTLDGAGGTRITNVSAGAVTPTSTDAVNGSQLNAVQAQVDGLQTQVTGNSTDITNLQTQVGGLQTQVTDNTTAITNLQTQVGDNTTAITNLETQVSGNTTAITNLETQVGGNTTAINNVNLRVDATNTALTQLTVAVTNGAVGPVQYSDHATPGVPNGGTPSNDVTLVGAAPGAVGLHNVANGVIAAGSTDAVNGGQIHNLAAAAQNSVQYSTDGNGNRTNTVLLQGGNPAATVTISGLAAGAVHSTSTEAVNGSQLSSTNQAVTAAKGTADAALALSQNSLQYDAGRGSITLAPGGAAPVALRNVAAGTANTDAVNLGQLTAAAGNSVSVANAYTDMRLGLLDFDLRNVRRDARSGSAAALAAAAMPQAMDSGRTMISGGVGTYGGRGAIALGASHRLANGHSVFRVGVTYDSSEKIGANAGAGFQF